MSLKRYITNCSKFSIYLNLEDGRSFKLSFEGKDAITKERFADIEDVQIQKELENSDEFGKYFTLSHEFDWITDETPKGITVIPGIISDVIPGVISEENITIQNEVPKQIAFRNGTEAKDWINKEHGVPYSKTTNKADMAIEFSKLGYQLEIESNKK